MNTTPITTKPPVNAGGKTTIENMAEELLQAGSIPYFSTEPEPRQWLVDRFLPQGQVVLLAGLGAEGKTMLCLQWIMQLAAGIDFAKDAKTNTSKDFKALIVSAEDDKTELHLRLRRIAEYYLTEKKLSEKSLATIEKNITAITDDIAPEWFNSLTESGKNGVNQTISYTALKHLVVSQRYNLVVIDALTSAFAGNFNDMSQMQTTLKLCRELTKGGATVILIHHLNKSALSSIEDFDDLLSKCFGSIGTLNRIRHNLILYKNTLFVAKSNIARRCGVYLHKNKDYQAYEVSEHGLIEEEFFDDTIQSLNYKEGNGKSKEKPEEKEEVNASISSNLKITSLRKRRYKT